MIIGRKNSLTFGSHAGAKVSVIYHTFYLILTLQVSKTAPKGCFKPERQN